MINLLPPEEKRQLRAARSNTLLIRYNIFLVGAMLFTILAVAITYVYLSNTKTAAERQINDNKAKVAQYAAVEQNAKTFRSNLSTAKEILANEFAYTKAIFEVSKLLPPGAVLVQLTLDPQTFGSETTLAAKVKDYSTALALKDAFQNSNVFSNVHFQNISAGDGQSTDDYPLAVNINVTIKKEVIK